MRILILQAHPRPSHSIAQKALSTAARAVTGVTLHDLYAAYPDFAINAKAEQDLLMAHDLVIFQHPFYWYSSPAIIKEWQDIVLDFGWAYGPGGNKLHGKFLMNAISTGGSEGFYRAEGRNRHTIEQFLAPFSQTAHLCGMAYLKPFIVYEGRKLDKASLARQTEAYGHLLQALAEDREQPLKRLAESYVLPASFKAKVST